MIFKREDYIRKPERQGVRFDFQARGLHSQTRAAESLVCFSMREDYICNRAAGSSGFSSERIATRAAGSSVWFLSERIILSKTLAAGSSVRFSSERFTFTNTSSSEFGLI